MAQQITERGGESNFISDDNGGTTNTMLAAALAAMGIPFDKKPSTIVRGDGIAGSGRITWYFAPKSECGKYATKQLIAAWDDKQWHIRNPEHPFAYIKCAMQNFTRLMDRIHKDIPLGMVRKRGKIALISLNSSQDHQDIIFRKL